MAGRTNSRQSPLPLAAGQEDLVPLPAGQRLRVQLKDRVSFFVVLFLNLFENFETS